MLLTLQYGGQMERAQMARKHAEETGMSIRESERVVDCELFLDEYPRWGLGTPHWSVVLHEMFLHATGWGQKEAEHMCCQGCQGSVPEPEPGVDLSTMELVGYWTSRREIQDIYHSIYLLRRAPGTPSCWEWERRWAIHDILASLTVWLQRRTPPAATREWSRMGQEGSYKVTLWVACHRALETAEALHSDLERLKRGRRRSQAHSWSQSRGRSGTWSRAHSRTPSQTHSRGPSQDQTRAGSWSCHHGDPQGICPWSPDRPPPQRRVSFHKPTNVKEPVKEEASSLMEPSVDDLEMWLDFKQVSWAPPHGGESWQPYPESRIGANSWGRSECHSMYLKST